MRNKADAPEPIAVVGVGCRLPGGIRSVEDFWQVLEQGKDCITPVPEDRWDNRRFQDDDPSAVAKTRVREAGFLQLDMNAFDASFFGIPVREAALMDPRQWLLMESAWEAFEDAGIRPSDMAGERVGVFAGVFLNDSVLHRMGPMALPALDGALTRASSQTMLAARISHFFDLRGPSFVLDTACSGSLVAAHLACQSLWRGESTQALVAGANLLLRPEPMVVLDKGGFLNEAGRCKAFDTDAAGYVRSEGAVVLLLEPLSVAQTAGRRIYSMICASGCNNDGKTPGITVPRADAQAAILRGLFDDARVPPTAVDFVEAHGTGTPVGDPTEMRALESVLGPGRQTNRPCWVGSVKSNLGHLEAAAGVAGLLKATLCLHHGRVVPSIHFETLNPSIDLSSGALTVADRNAHLDGPGPWHAVVNSFGYGGTNATVLLRSAPAKATESQVQDRPGPWLVPLTARSEHSRQKLAGAYADWLEAGPDVSVPSLARTAHGTRDNHRFRAAVVADNPKDLGRLLRLLQDGEPDDDLVLGTVGAGAGPVFVYTGMGAQSWGMADALLRDDPGTLRECADHYRELLDLDLREVFDPESGLRRESAHQAGMPMRDPAFAQPANLVVQVALTRHWKAQGVEPVAVVGHSVGEVAAAWAAGMLTLEDAFRIIAARVEALSQLRGSGTMLAIQGPFERLASLLDRPDLGVRLATWNSPVLGLASGPRAGLEKLAVELEAEGARCALVPVDVPYHHPSIEPYGERFLRRTSDLQAHAAKCPFYSTWTGARLEQTKPEHWWRACADPVRLDQAVEAIRSDGHTLFLEVGPHPTVTPSFAQGFMAVGERAETIPSMRRGHGDVRALARARARLFVRGTWSPPSEPHVHLDLPRYAWERTRHGTLTASSSRFLFGTNEHPLLQRRHTGPNEGWSSQLVTAFLPYLHGHRVLGRVVFPAAGFIETGLAVGNEIYGLPIELEHVQFHRMLPPEERPQVDVTIEPGTGEFSVRSSATVDETDWVTNAVGRLVRGADAPSGVMDLDGLRSACPEELDVGHFYDRLEGAGFEYGRGFRSIRRLWRGQEQVLAELHTDADCSEHLAHPCLVDGAIQTLLAALGTEGDIEPYVPVRVGRTSLAGPLGPRAWLHARFERRGPTVLVGQLVLATPDLRVQLVMRDLRYQRLQVGAISDGKSRPYVERWELDADDSPTSEPPGSWLLLEQVAGCASAMATELRSRSVHVRVLPLTRESLPDPEALRRSAVALCLRSPLGSDFIPAPLGADGASHDLVGVALELCRRLAMSSEPPPLLGVVTDRAFRIEMVDGPVDPGQRAIWGLVRVLSSEVPRLVVRRVDAARCEPAKVVDALLLDSREDETALRGPLRFQHRVVDLRGVQHGVPVPLPVATPVRLRPDTAGSVRFEEGVRQAPGPDEIECRVWLAGLNFKDVLKVQHRLPQEYVERSFSGDDLGMEFVGEVVRVGKDVDGFGVGDAVYGLARAALGTYVRCRLTVARLGGGRLHAPMVFKLPRARAPEEFLGLVNYLTAWHGLVQAGRLERDETVLVQSAAGGVGLAAVHVARFHGARVLAAAGTDEKRAYLTSLGVDRVCDSRSLGFADQALNWTDGVGVDVALGAFQREALIRALGALAPFGRLVDIGKAETLKNAPLPLGTLDGNRTLTAFDLDLADGQRALYRSMRQLEALLARGDLPPLPVRVFAAPEVNASFRLLARGEHIGKIAVDLREGPLPVVRLGAEGGAEGTTLLIGGLGGLGLPLARWLVRRGRRHLVLIGRSQPRPDAQAALQRLGRRAQVRVVQVDATDPVAMERVLNELRAWGPPLSGVYHLASVWDDQPLATVDDVAFARVYATKVGVAATIHDLTVNDPIREFVLFSSISALIGNPGQAAYCAGNSFLEGLAHRRRALGLPALAFQLGLVGDLGVAADDPRLTGALRARGVEPIAFEEALAGLGQLLDGHAIQGAVAAVDWSRLHRSRRLPPRFSRLAGDGSGLAGASEARQAVRALRSATGTQRQALAVRLLTHCVAGIVGVEPSRVDPDLVLADMGLDSLMAVELTAGLSELTEVVVPTELVISGGTLRECAAAIADLVSQARTTEPNAPSR